MAATASTLTAQQQEARKGRITSTRIVKLVNGRQWDVWAEMMGVSAPVQDNPRMRFGRKLERAIIEAAAEDKGWPLVHYQPGTVIRGDYATSPDAYVGGGPRMDPATVERVIEAKNRGAEQARKYDGNEPTPDELVQVSWHSLVTGIPDASVCVLLGGNDLRVFDVTADPEVQAGLCEIADRFLTDYVRPQRPPPMDASDAAAEYLRARFPRHTAPLLTADEVATQWMAELRHFRAERDSYEAMTTAKENQLKALIGDAEGIESAVGRITWKATKGRKVVCWEEAWAELQQYAPEKAREILTKCTEEKPGPRVFRATFKENA